MDTLDIPAIFFILFLSAYGVTNLLAALWRERQSMQETRNRTHFTRR